MIFKTFTTKPPHDKFKQQLIQKFEPAKPVRYYTPISSDITDTSRTKKCCLGKDDAIQTARVDLSHGSSVTTGSKQKQTTDDFSPRISQLAHRLASRRKYNLKQVSLQEFIKHNDYYNHAD